jgi:ribose 5-phosphate isomerase B
MKLFLAADHGGLALKEALMLDLKKNHTLQIEDLGTHSDVSVDYPDFAHILSQRILKEPGSCGILICGTGIGMSIVANRHPGIRAALVTTSYMAEMAKKHNNANVLCFGGRVVKADEARAMVKIWLESAYEGGRHENRLKKI